MMTRVFFPVLADCKRVNLVLKCLRLIELIVHIDDFIEWRY